MSKLEEVPQETPILDAIEGRSALVGGLLREGKRWFTWLRRRRQQKHIDKAWHSDRIPVDRVRESGNMGVSRGDE